MGGALCGLDDGALTPANWLAMLTGLADRIEDLGDALVGNLAGDPVISGIAAQLGFDFADLGAGFTTVADTVRSFTDQLARNTAMDAAWLREVTAAVDQAEKAKGAKRADALAALGARLRQEGARQADPAKVAMLAEAVEALAKASR